MAQTTNPKANLGAPHVGFTCGGFEFSTGTAPSSCSDTANIGNLLDMSYNFSLGAGDNGNVNSITNNRDKTRSQSFTYDALNRLASAQTQTSGVTIPNSNCWGLTFGYDPWGNLLSSTSSGPAGCGEPLPLNASVTTKNQISGYCYDFAGNLLDQGACPSGAHAYFYNAENQLVSTAGVSYLYDGDGKRVSKSNGKLYWYGMGSDVLDESDSSGNLTNEYVFFNGTRIARRDSSNNVDYYFADHLGTARVVTNAAGAILDDSDFYPFGGERLITSSSGNTYKFTGKERDSESGIDNFGARYYSSSMGRWAMPDWSAAPVGVPYADFGSPQSLNLYSYVKNNPLTFADRDGHCVWDGCALEIAAGVTAVALIAYGYHHFFKTVDKGVAHAKEAAKAHQESIDAATRADELGNAEKADKKDAEYHEKAKEALKDAAEATIEGVQLPGTSTGGDIGLTPADAAAAVVTGIVGSAMMDSAKKDAEQRAQQQKQEQQKKEKETKENK